LQVVPGQQVPEARDGGGVELVGAKTQAAQGTSVRADPFDPLAFGLAPGHQFHEPLGEQPAARPKHAVAMAQQCCGQRLVEHGAADHGVHLGDDQARPEVRFCDGEPARAQAGRAQRLRHRGAGDDARVQPGETVG